jgi:glycosyltransferase involved in cell wall biosynthesis
VTRLLLFANTDWYLYNHRLALARMAREQGMEVSLVSPKGNYVEKLRAEGFPWFELPLDRSGMNVLREALAVLRCTRLYKSLQPDLVHHFTVKPVFYGSLAARWAGVPALVNSITGLGYLFTNPSPYVTVIRWLLKPIYMRAMAHPNQRIIFQHEGDLQAYLELGLVRREDTTIIPGSGVNLTRFQPRDEPPEPPLILMATRMLWDKGVGDLIEAVRRMQAHRITARVALVGRPDEGNPSSIPAEQLEEWQREGFAEWWGHQEDMPAIFAQSHIVVLPSYSEGVPKCLIEAAAMGKPIVASDLPGCRAIVQDEWNGLLVAPRDPVALSKALQRLVTDRNLRRSMGHNGRKIVEERFDDRIINQKNLTIYNELLARQERISNND